MLNRWMALQQLSRGGIWVLGFAITFFTGLVAWAQQGGTASIAEPRPGATADPEADRQGKGVGSDLPAAKGDPKEATAGKPSLAEQRATREWLEEQVRSLRARLQRHPAEEEALAESRAEAELLEAQIDAKEAHIKLVEARLKHAKARQELQKKSSGKGPDDGAKRVECDGEVGILEAELDTERAELKEPKVLLKYAQRRIKHLEGTGQGSGQPHLGWGGPAGMPHSGMAMHPGDLQYHRMHSMGMAPMGQHPAEMHHMSVNRMMEVDDKLLQLRDAIEELEEEVGRLAGRSRR